MSQPLIRIIGIDPGLRRTGWGVIDIAGTRLTFVACGSVATDDHAAIGERLVTIHDGLCGVIDDFRPAESAVEATFVNKDATATLKLGQARGVVLLGAARAGMDVGEYAARLVKKSVVGVGNASKEQVHGMVQRLLPGAAIDGPDAADALAIAITHAHHLASARRMRAR